MVPVFPEGSFSLLALVKLLGNSASKQLQALGNNVLFRVFLGVESLSLTELKALSFALYVKDIKFRSACIRCSYTLSKSQVIQTGSAAGNDL